MIRQSWEISGTNVDGCIPSHACAHRFSSLKASRELSNIQAQSSRAQAGTGQTGSGKTHSLLGSGSEAGIIALAAADLFSEVHMNRAAYRVKVAMLELYNEELRDLLAVQEPAALHKRAPKLQIQVRQPFALCL